MLLSYHLPLSTQKQGQHNVIHAFTCSCQNARHKGQHFFFPWKVFFYDKDVKRGLRPVRTLKLNLLLNCVLVQEHFLDDKNSSMKLPVAEPFIHSDQFKHEDMSSDVLFLQYKSHSFYEMHIQPQIRGDCRAFVSAEPLFSLRFMIVAGSWQELVWLLLTHWFIPRF